MRGEAPIESVAKRLEGPANGRAPQDKVQEKVQESGIADTASQTWRNVMEKGKNVASIGKTRLNESIEAGKRKFNESMEDDDLAER